MKLDVDDTVTLGPGALHPGATGTVCAVHHTNHGTEYSVRLADGGMTLAHESEIASGTRR